MEHPRGDRPRYLTVVATTPRAVRAALHAAADLSQAPSVPLTLIVPVVVPFPAQLNEPPVGTAFVKQRYEVLAAGEGVDTRVDVYVCRNPRSLLGAALAAGAPVVMGLDGRGDLHTHRLARWLTAHGHRVLLAYPEPGGKTAGAVVRRWWQASRSAWRHRHPQLAILVACAILGAGSAARAQGAPLASAPIAEKTTAEPFAFADFTWLNGNSRTKDSPLDTKVFSGEFRLDANYVFDFNHPQDHTIDGSCETGRAGEIQVQQLGLGGDFHWDNVRGRLMTQFGMYSQMTPRNDSSPSRGQWGLADAYRYISEAYGGYHWDAMHGVNLDAGIFMSYVGLFSYYNFDNWAYQPSYVSANTPWFFNGLRVQVFPTDRLKQEMWIINGWQSYGMFNQMPGIGSQTLWRPGGSVSVLSNNYVGRDTLGHPDRIRLHSDSSLEVKYRDTPDGLPSKAAFSLTGDLGCERGGGVSCTGGGGGPAQYFAGFMFYNRFWFDHDRFAVTAGGGAITNPGRYLVLLPPINGATATSGTPYFTMNPGDRFRAWDGSVTLDYMPKQFITFRLEFDHRASDMPYFVGRGGITPAGGNVGPPGSVVDGFAPDLRRTENRINLALLVKL